MPNTLLTRSSVRPAFSMAARVFSKVGGSVLFAMASISRSVSAIPASRAGLKCSTLTLSKGGTPPYGPVQTGRRGLFMVVSAARPGVPAATVKSAVSPAPISKDLVIELLDFVVCPPGRQDGGRATDFDSDSSEALRKGPGGGL